MGRLYKTLSQIEGFGRRVYYKRSLKELEKVYPCKIRVFRPVKDEYSEVYGTEGGIHINEKEFDEIDVLISNDPWSPLGFYEAGTLTEGWIFTEDDRITSDLVFRVVRIVTGGVELSRRYKIREKQAYGTTQAVETRWRIEPLGD